MSIQTIARRYAAALADVVLERGEANTIQQELQQWSQLILGNENLQSGETGRLGEERKEGVR